MQLPSAVRAAVGLAALAAEEARHLPERAIELPMLAVSSALQASLRAQQRYARLTARGDEVLHRRPPTDEPPPWATFDAPVDVAELRTAAEHAAAPPPGTDVAADPSADVPQATVAPIDTAAIRRAARKRSAPKKITAPRNGKASAFDRAGTPDDDTPGDA